jgi:hypothetical protein
MSTRNGFWLLASPIRRLAQVGALSGNDPCYGLTRISDLGSRAENGKENEDDEEGDSNPSRDPGPHSYCASTWTALQLLRHWPAQEMHGGRDRVRVVECASEEAGSQVVMAFWIA